MSTSIIDRILDKQPPAAFHRFAWGCSIINIFFLMNNIFRNTNYIKNSAVSVRRLLTRKKTFYFDKIINDKSVDEFKSFMIDIGSDEEIDIVIKTNGGGFTSSQIISNIIGNHDGTINALVLENSFSGGTLIALSCDNLYMHKNAHLSPVDVIHCNFFDAVQLSSIESVLSNKNKDKIEDKTYILSDQAKKAQLTLDDIFNRIIKPKYTECAQEKIREDLFSGTKHLHSTAFSVDKLKELGVDVQPLTQNMISVCKLTYPINHDMF